jgi:hypothetical protein
MAVLKQTSPTAEPTAPKPRPEITVPSARTRRAVIGESDQGAGVLRLVEALASMIEVMCCSGRRRLKPEREAPFRCTAI